MVVFILNFISLYSLVSYAETNKTEISQEDNDILKYYHVPTVDEDFEDNEVWVILKSEYNNLNEIKFKDFEIVEKVSRISYIWYQLKEFHYEDEKFTLQEEKNHMFKIVLEERSKEKVIAVCNLLNSLDMVLVSQPNYIYGIIEDWVPNDSEYSLQWGLHNSYGINVEQAWEIATGDVNIKVGIMEGGSVDKNHIDLDGRVFDGNSSAEISSHATGVAGIIGAKQNNNTGIAGVAECSMYVLNAGNFVESINYAKLNNIKIINASFGFELLNGQSAPYNYKPYDSAHFEALKNYDGIFIGTAGNDDNNNDVIARYPASYDLPNVISVGSINKNGEKSYFSNYGKSTVDLFAPGSEIYTLKPNNSFDVKNGTSFAAPHVAGVATLIYAKYPYLSASDVKDSILNNVDKLDNLDGLCVTGGKLNAYKALKNVNHTHNYSHNYKYSDKTMHKAFCWCGEFITERHATNSSNVIETGGHFYAKCSGCKRLINLDDSFIPIIKPSSLNLEGFTVLSSREELWDYFKNSESYDKFALSSCDIFEYYDERFFAQYSLIGGSRTADAVLENMLQEITLYEKFKYLTD